MANKPETGIVLTKDAQKAKDALELTMQQVTRTPSILNENQVQKLFNSTPRRNKYKRPAKGGGEWDYVKTSYVRRVLDSVFGFNWDFEIQTSAMDAFEIAKATKSVVVTGSLTGRVKVDGQWVSVTKTQAGRADVKFKKNSQDPLDFGNDLKSAISDCLKKCASQFGIAADVYEREEFMEIEIIGSEENSERRKNQESMVDQAKKTLKERGKEVD